MELLERVTTRPRQVRYQAALRPDICWFLHSKPLLNLPHIAATGALARVGPTVLKTVLKPLNWAPLRLVSIAGICLREKFLNKTTAGHDCNFPYIMCTYMF